MSTKEQNQDDAVVVEATAAVPVVDTAEAIAYEVPGGKWKVRTITIYFENVLVVVFVAVAVAVAVAGLDDVILLSHYHRFTKLSLN